MRLFRSTAFVAFSGLCLGLGCQIIAGIEGTAELTSSGSGGSSSSSGMGGGGGASSSSSSSGGMGGMGGSLECVTVSNCKSSECKTAKACTNGVCEWNYIAKGNLTDSQLYGDCQDRACDGAGNIQFIDTSAEYKDRYTWNNPCYVDGCNAWLMPKPAGGGAGGAGGAGGGPVTPVKCTTPWGNTNGICQAFKCIECTAPEDCASGACSAAGRCVLAPCLDGMVNSGETDIDCGGPSCTPCGEGRACLADSDCTGKCVNMVCAAPSCSDGIRNQDETDVDCGGACAMAPNPSKCADFKQCLFPKDCVSGFCKNSQCQAASCLDQIQNQDEAGIDCGGICPLPCP